MLPKAFWTYITGLLLLGTVAICHADELNKQTVNQKIQALGIRNDLLKHEDKPRVWLSEHRSQCMPELINGLASPVPRIAEGCFTVLADRDIQEQLIPVFMRLAGDSSHHLHSKAIGYLCRYMDNPSIKSGIGDLLKDDRIHAEPVAQSDVLAAFDRKADAAAILNSHVTTIKNEWEIKQLIKRVAKLRQPSSKTVIKQKMQTKDWETVAVCHIALNTIAPEEYPLTDAQKLFLTESSRRFKESLERSQERWRRVPKQGRDDVRPFIVENLNSNSPRPGLYLLQLWMDAAALPELKAQLAQQRRGWIRGEFLAAYLLIDGTEDTIKKTLNLGPGRRDSYLFETLIRCIAISPASPERKLKVLEILKRHGLARSVAIGCRWLPRSEDGNDVFTELMMNEKELGHLTRYFEHLSERKHPRLLAAVEAGIARVAAKEAFADTDIHDVAKILDACTPFKPGNIVPLAKRLINSEHPLLRVEAARLLVTLDADRKAGLDLLLKSLVDPDKKLSLRASECLLSIPCRTDEERSARVTQLIALAKSSEFKQVIPIFATCLTEEAERLLEPIMDSEDMTEALSAALVLTKSSDDELSLKAERRFYIHRFWRRNDIPQQAKPHDTVMVADRGYELKNRKILIEKRVLTKLEADFAIRSFESTNQFGIGSDASPLHHPFVFNWNPSGSRYWDISHLEVLKAIAERDLGYQVFEVDGKKIVHLPARQNAARVIRELTGKPATYIGLNGKPTPADRGPDIENNLADLSIFLITYFRPQLFPNDKGIPAHIKEKSSKVNSLIQYFASSQYSFSEEQRGEFREAFRKEAEKQNILELLKKLPDFDWL